MVPIITSWLVISAPNAILTRGRCRIWRTARRLGADTRGLAPIEAAEAGIEELYRLTEDVGIPTMEGLGFSEEEILHLARIAFEDPQTVGNPREVTVSDYAEIYRNAFSRGK